MKQMKWWSRCCSARQRGWKLRMSTRRRIRSRTLRNMEAGTRWRTFSQGKATMSTLCSSTRPTAAIPRSTPSTLPPCLRRRRHRSQHRPRATLSERACQLSRSCRRRHQPLRPRPSQRRPRRQSRQPPHPHLPRQRAIQSPSLRGLRSPAVASSPSPTRSAPRSGRQSSMHRRHHGPKMCSRLLRRGRSHGPSSLTRHSTRPHT
mmetsp:Transcript_23116/g.55308  ORF Transcript_23116/g.55308 Transcript_23116/m.55308 type:complete len:204 (+) Transcript_23116:1-612(+)